MNTKQLSWQTLVLQRVVAALELAGQRVGRISWGFERGEPTVAVQVFDERDDALAAVRLRLSHVDGIEEAVLIGSTVYCKLKKPTITELHVEGRLGKED